jgi:hypothetical protein
MPEAQFIRKTLDVQLPRQLFSAYLAGHFPSIHTIDGDRRLADSSPDRQ